MRRGLPMLALAGLLLGTALAAPAETVLRLRPLAAATRHLEEGPLQQPLGVAWDPKGDELWVADSRNDLLGVFKTDGTPVYATDGAGTIVEPRQVALDPDGGLWVLDSDRTRIARLDWRGRPLPSPVLAGLPEEPVIGAIAFDEEGNLYVGENAEGRVHVFDRSLAPRFRFGSRGFDDEQFAAIVDIAVAGEWIVVVDAIARPVQLFNRRGEFERGWGEHALGAENFSLPQGVALDGEGHVIVVDSLRHEIKFFDTDGRFLGRFGGFGSLPGQVVLPVDVATDRAGHLYVAEKGNGRVQALAIERVDPLGRASGPAPRR